MATMYNEIDQFASEWLGNLIMAGELPQGTVNTCSIKELSGADCGETTHLFAGIGGWPLALRLAGWPDERAVWTGSCPCQPYSAAGKGKGDADERNLWPEMYRLIRECRPAVIFGEQVAGAAVTGGKTKSRQNLQEMQDRETVFRILRELQGEPGPLQGMRPQSGTDTEANRSSQNIAGLQSVAGRESGPRPCQCGQASRQEAGNGVRSGPGGYSAADRGGTVRTERDTFRLIGAAGLECAVSGQDRLNFGLHDEQCSSDFVCPECGGEYLGTWEDFGDCIGDFDQAAECFARVIEQDRRESQEAIGYGWIDGVRADLEREGYAFGFHVLPACSVGSPNIRQRAFWVADSSSGRGIGSNAPIASSDGEDDWILSGSGRIKRLAHGARADAHATASTPRGAIGESSGADRLGDTNGEQDISSIARQQMSSEGRDRVDRNGGGSIPDNPWCTFKIIGCKDGKSRRVGRSVQPLAYGIPVQLRPLFAWLGRLGIDASPLTKMARLARRNRTGRLKGYGNAINPFVAAEFVKAFLACE